MNIALFVLLAALIESVAQGVIWTIGSDHKIEWGRVIPMIVSLLVCVLISDADLFSAAGFHFSLPYVGNVLTGVIVARGSNFVHDLLNSVGAIKNLVTPKQPQ